MSKLTHSQIFDAVRRHSEETEQQAADRIGISKRTVNTYINHPEKFNPDAWLKVLNAYGLNADAALAIADSMPVLRKTAVQEEEDRRKAELAANPNAAAIKTRNPLDRKAGEPRFWQDDRRFFEKGSKTPPISFNDNQKVYTVGHSTVMACLEALQDKGRPTDKESVVKSYTRNTLCRTPNIGQAEEDKLRGYAETYFDALVESGDILVGEDGCELSEYVYEGIGCFPVGSPMYYYPSRNPSQSSFEYVPWGERFEMLEDLEDQPWPEKSQYWGVALTEEEIKAIELRTGLKYVGKEPKKENTSDLI